MARTFGFVRPEKCLGPCGKPLHVSTKGKPMPPGSVRHRSQGYCNVCVKLVKPRQDGVETPRGSVSEHCAALGSFIRSRRARGVPEEGLLQSSPALE